MKRKFKEWDDERHLEVLRENEQKKVCKKCPSWDVCVYKKAFDGRCVCEERSDEIAKGSKAENKYVEMR